MNLIAEPRTLERRLKFDYGLPTGLSLIWLVKGERRIKVLVHITARGAVTVCSGPRVILGAMVLVWDRLKGDHLYSDKGGSLHVINQDHDMVRLFTEGNPVAEIPVVEE